MGYAVLAYDGEDDAAPARRMAVRDKHLEVLTAWAADGRLALGVPIFTAEGRVAGSLMVLEVPDRAGLDAYLAAEPFARGEVWRRVTVHPFRIAPLPYRPLPQPGAPTPASRTHTVILAMDGRDPGALARRLKVREAHMARAGPMAADGTLTIGGAILDETEGHMIGSIAVTAHTTDTAARTWMAEDPYVTGDVWRDVTLYGTRFAPLPPIGRCRAPMPRLVEYAEAPPEVRAVYDAIKSARGVPDVNKSLEGTGGRSADPQADLGEPVPGDGPWRARPADQGDALPRRLHGRRLCLLHRQPWHGGPRQGHDGRHVRRIAGRGRHGGGDEPAGRGAAGSDRPRLRMRRDIRLCFLGDSFTAGAGDATGLGWVGRVTATAWARGAALTAYNLGIRRDTSAHIRRRAATEVAPRLEGAGAHGVVLCFGVNDTTWRMVRFASRPRIRSGMPGRCSAGRRRDGRR